MNYGESALINSKPCPENPKLRTPPEIEEKILYVRKNYYLGQLRISWYLKCYHGMIVSPSAVRNVLVRHGLNRLPKNQRKRTIESRYKRYKKQVPGHRIQVDVKFLDFVGKDGRKIRRFQYTAIDDATRIRALKSYKKHTQLNAIDFINYVIKKFPFRFIPFKLIMAMNFRLNFIGMWKILVSDTFISGQVLRVLMEK